MVPVTTNQKYIMDQPSINNQPSFCWWGTRTGWICIVSVCAFLILSLSVADARAAFSTSPGPRTASRKEGSSAHGHGEGPWLSSQDTCAHLISSYISCLFSSLISSHLISSNQYFVSSYLIVHPFCSTFFSSFFIFPETQSGMIHRRFNEFSGQVSISLT